MIFYPTYKLFSRVHLPFAALLPPDLSEFISRHTNETSWCYFSATKTVNFRWQFCFEIINSLNILQLSIHMFQDLKSIIAQYFLIKFFFVRGESNNPVGFHL